MHSLQSICTPQNRQICPFPKSLKRQIDFVRSSLGTLSDVQLCYPLPQNEHTGKYLEFIHEEIVLFNFVDLRNLLYMRRKFQTASETIYMYVST